MNRGKTRGRQAKLARIEALFDELSDVELDEAVLISRRYIRDAVALAEARCGMTLGELALNKTRTAPEAMLRMPLRGGRVEDMLTPEERRQVLADCRYPTAEAEARPVFVDRFHFTVQDVPLASKRWGAVEAVREALTHVDLNEDGARSGARLAIAMARLEILDWRFDEHAPIPASRAEKLASVGAFFELLV